MNNCKTEHEVIQIETNKTTIYSCKEYLCDPKITDRIQYNETMQQSQYTRGKVDVMKTRILDIEQQGIYALTT